MILYPDDTPDAIEAKGIEVSTIPGKANKLSEYLIEGAERLKLI